MNYLAKRLDAIKPSTSAAVSQNAKALKAEGHDVIDLGLGEPDFDTPAHVVEAAYQAAKVGEKHYPPADGNGAKQVIFDAFIPTFEKTSEVLLCAPYFGQYKDTVLILGRLPIVIDCPPDNGFRLTPESLEAAITPHTRWLLLNLPSNPSGTSYGTAVFRAWRCNPPPSARVGYVG
ncbi:aminotransferase class I/II-fold pyridoxal phosphate-dependent enzyme [Ascidiaceihabitans sp.]|nr:aminotransferase class I/II-fold pyridoxal phosphate-dependent enzyme [Ascidiaceihabitans sp.]